MPWKAPLTPNKPAFCHLPLPGPLLWGPMAQSVSKNTRLGQTRAGMLSVRAGSPLAICKGPVWLPRHSISFIRMGPELAATDLWTHSITAGMKAEKKVAKELPFLSSWDGERSGQWDAVLDAPWATQRDRTQSPFRGPSGTSSQRWPSTSTA